MKQNRRASTARVSRARSDDSVQSNDSENFHRLTKKENFEFIQNKLRKTWSANGLSFPENVEKEFKKRILRASTLNEKAKLVFSNSNLTDKHVIYLIEALAMKPVIAKLDLRDNNLTDESINVLVKLLKGQLKLVRDIAIDKRLGVCFLGDVLLSNNSLSISPKLLEKILQLTETLKVANAKTYIYERYSDHEKPEQITQAYLFKMWFDVVGKNDQNQLSKALQKTSLVDIKYLNYEQLETVLIQGLIIQGKLDLKFSLEKNSLEAALIDSNEVQMNKSVEALEMQEVLDHTKGMEPTELVESIQEEKINCDDNINPIQSMESTHPVANYLDDSHSNISSPTMSGFEESIIVNENPSPPSQLNENADKGVAISSQVPFVSLPPSANLNSMFSEIKEDQDEEENEPFPSINHQIHQPQQEDLAVKIDIKASSLNIDLNKVSIPNQSNFIELPKDYLDSSKNHYVLFNEILESTKSISDLLDKQPLLNLRILILRNCGLSNLTDLDLFMQLPNVVELDLGYNSFSEKILDIDLPRKLKKLDLSHNQLSDIDGIVSCVELQDLDLSFNQIRIINGFPTKLRRLDISNNKIATPNTLRCLALCNLLVSVNVEKNDAMSKIPNIRVFFKSLIPNIFEINHILVKPMEKSKTNSKEAVTPSTPQKYGNTSSNSKIITYEKLALDRQNSKRINRDAQQKNDEKRSKVYQDKLKQMQAFKDAKIRNIEELNNAKVPSLPKAQIENITNRLYNPKKPLLQNKSANSGQSYDLLNPTSPPKPKIVPRKKDRESLGDILQEDNNKLNTTVHKVSTGEKLMNDWIDKSSMDLTGLANLFKFVLQCADNQEINEKDVSSFNNALYRARERVSLDIPLNLKRILDTKSKNYPKKSEIFRLQKEIESSILILQQIQTILIFAADGSINFIEGLDLVMGSSLGMYVNDQVFKNFDCDYHFRTSPYLHPATGINSLESPAIYHSDLFPDHEGEEFAYTVKDIKSQENTPTIANKDIPIAPLDVVNFLDRVRNRITKKFLPSNIVYTHDIYSDSPSINSQNDEFTLGEKFQTSDSPPPPPPISTNSFPSPPPQESKEKSSVEPNNIEMKDFPVSEIKHIEATPIPPMTDLHLMVDLNSLGEECTPIVSLGNVQALSEPRSQMKSRNLNLDLSQLESPSHDDSKDAEEKTFEDIRRRFSNNRPNSSRSIVSTVELEPEDINDPSLSGLTPVERLRRRIRKNGDVPPLARYDSSHDIRTTPSATKPKSVPSSSDFFPNTPKSNQQTSMVEVLKHPEFIATLASISSNLDDLDLNAAIINDHHNLFNESFDGYLEGNQIIRNPIPSVKSALEIFEKPKPKTNDDIVKNTSTLDKTTIQDVPLSVNSSPEKLEKEFSESSILLTLSDSREIFHQDINKDKNYSNIELTKAVDDDILKNSNIENHLPEIIHDIPDSEISNKINHETTNELNAENLNVLKEDTNFMQETIPIISPQIPQAIKESPRREDLIPLDSKQQEKMPKEIPKEIPRVNTPSKKDDSIPLDSKRQEEMPKEIPKEIPRVNTPPKKDDSIPLDSKRQEEIPKEIPKEIPRVNTPPKKDDSIPLDSNHQEEMPKEIPKEISKTKSDKKDAPSFTKELPSNIPVESTSFLPITLPNVENLQLESVSTKNQPTPINETSSKENSISPTPSNNDESKMSARDRIRARMEKNRKTSTD